MGPLPDAAAPVVASSGLLGVYQRDITGGFSRQTLVVFVSSMRVLNKKKA